MIRFQSLATARHGIPTGLFLLIVATLGPASAAQDIDADPVAAVQQAHDQTKTAKTVADFTAIIEQCEAALSAGLDQQWTEYTNRLLAWTYDHRGEAQVDRGQEEDAFNDFSRAVKYDPTRWKALHNRAVSHAMAGRFDEALEDFGRTIELNRSYGDAYFNRGEVLYELGQFQQAIEDYNQAARLMPNDSAVYNSRGHAYYRLGDYQAAVADYTQAVRYDPQNAAAYTNRGDAYADKGRFAQAATDYRRAIRIDPELGRAYQSAAWLMATCRDEQFRNPKLAMQAATKAIELDGREGNYRYLDTLAAALAANERFDEAIATLEEAIAVAPDALQQAYGERLKLYRNDDPYRDGWRTDVSERQ